MSLVPFFLIAMVLIKKSPAPTRPRPDFGVPVEIRLGQGKLVEVGDEVTIEYRICDQNKKEYGNSMKRGMPFTIEYGGRNSEPLVSVALSGMRVGGNRYVVLPGDAFAAGIGSIVPPKTDLTIWVHVVSAKAGKVAKVELPYVERAQGAVEVPRAVAHNGSARN